MGVFTWGSGRGRGVQWVGDAGRRRDAGGVEEESRGKEAGRGVHLSGGGHRCQGQRRFPRVPQRPSLCLPSSLQCYEAMAEALQDGSVPPPPSFPS